MTPINKAHLQQGGGVVTLTLSVNNALQNGGTFKVVKIPSNELVESITLPKQGQFSATLQTAPAQLAGCGLVFKINVCTAIPTVTVGEAAVSLSQMGEPCVTDRPLIYDMTDIPQCDTGEARVIEDKLIWQLS